MKKALKESAELKLQIANTMAEQVSETAKLISSAIKSGRKVMLCGNGGSAADSQHLAAELVVRLTGKVNRKALPGMALTTDPSILTAASNDFGFENVFSRQVEAHGIKGDILIAISTSGNSPNIIKAVDTAKKMDIVTIGFLGNDGGKLGSLVDLALIVPSDDTQRIQEAHITIGHIIISMVEKSLFSAR
ncbi:MAG: D-sedoheptulose 7-phosphate isomerase [Candidatus Zixiibacteriota bacterium]|nr:MAG: D-sedoheptulose 7-phosphate isomerase [candidate division Zixibacteria bacterium]